MEMVWIEPDGGFRGLNTEIAEPAVKGAAVDLHDYGVHHRCHGGCIVPAMTWEAFERAQRDCFRAFYVRASRLLGPIRDVVTRDKTILANLLSMGFDVVNAESGGKIIEDASPQGMELMVSGSRHELDEYVKVVRRAAKEYMLRISSNPWPNKPLILEADLQEFHVTPEFNRVKPDSSGFAPFRLPTVAECRAFDREAISRLFKRGLSLEQTEEMVRMFSPMTLYWNTYILVQRKAIYGDRSYVKGIVAETYVDGIYPDKIKSSWAKKVSELVEKSMLWNGTDMDSTVPCILIDRCEDGMLDVAVNDADVVVNLPHKDDCIYHVSPELLAIWLKDGASVSEINKLGIPISCIRHAGKG